MATGPAGRSRDFEVAFLFVRPLTTDGMAKENAEFRAHLEANGYDTSQMGLHSEASTFC